MGIPALTTHPNNTVLGAQIVQSSVFFQASAAELIGAEGSKLQKLISYYSTHTNLISTLTTTNRQIQLTMGALSTLESLIIKKIGIGTRIHNKTLTTKW